MLGPKLGGTVGVFGGKSVGLKLGEIAGEDFDEYSEVNENNNSKKPQTLPQPFILFPHFLFGRDSPLPMSEKISRASGTALGAALSSCQRLV